MFLCLYVYMFIYFLNFIKQLYNRMLKIFLISTFFYINQSFLFNNNKFNIFHNNIYNNIYNKFNIKKIINEEYKDIKELVQYNLSNEDYEIIKNINGFFGLIGPNVNLSKSNSIYDLFNGNGIIQGLFMKNGELTFIKHYIKTDKFLYEESFNNLTKNNPLGFIFTILSYIKILPNMFGTANTALLNINNNIYALFERDIPYHIDIDFNNKDVKTIKKYKIKDINYFSAHSKFNNNIIETIECDVINKNIKYYELDQNFTILKKIIIKTNYIAFAHDFYSTSNKIIIIDSPFIYDFKNIFKKNIPILFDNKKETFIHILDKEDSITKTYKLNKSFYIFHYADYIETDENIEIYTTIYDKIDFIDYDIKCALYKIIINKKTDEIKLVKIDDLNNYNIDFPVKFNNNIIFTHSDTKKKLINGFIITHNFKIIKKIFFKNKIICGEPSIININKIPYLLSFTFSDKNNYITLINLENYYIIDIPIQTNLTIGFHSIFVNNSFS